MKLTATQKLIIESALDDESFIVTIPPTIKGGAFAKTTSSMINKGLIFEAEDEDGGICHIATIEALDAIGADDALKVAHGICYAEETLNLTATLEDPEPAFEDGEQETGCLDDSEQNDQLVAKPPRSGTKMETVITLLTRKGGATMQEVIDATNWQAHTARSQISTGAKKYGYSFTSERHGSKLSTVYKIEGAAA